MKSSFFERLVKAFTARGSKTATSDAIKEVVVGEVKDKKKHWQGPKFSGAEPTSKDMLRKKLRKIQKQSKKRNRDT